MSVMALFVTVGACLPIGFIVYVAVQTGWSTASALIFRPRVGELLVNTLLLVACTLPLCIVFSVALAWLTERSDLPGAHLWSWLIVAPLAIPAFVHSYAWVSFIPSLNGLFAAVLISTLAYVPFLYLPIAATLRRLDPALEEAAASLGHPPAQVFLRVVVPQLRLALCGGGLLVALHLLAEFGLYVMVRFDTFTTAIVAQFQSAYNGPAANMLAGVLALCCFSFLGLEMRLRGHERYARVGSGAARARRPAPLNVWKAPALAGLVAWIALAVGVPIVTLSGWLLQSGAAVWRLQEILPAVLETLLFAGLGGVLATLAAIPIAWLSIRAPGPLQRLVEGLNYVVGSLPGVVVALALVTITVRIALPLYQTIATVLLAYVLLFLPRAIISLRASLAQAPVELEQAAASLGRTPLNALWSVTVRLAAPGAAAGMALVGLGIVNELTATQMLAPNGTQTLATAFWAYTSELDYAAAAPYALLMILLSLPLTGLLYAQSKRTIGR
ncbi:MAG: binding-protein-dependent transport system inner rane protein [Hyphomicrobiales bacterium]|nr:binding-protein-dependent transport system inner rane protein [Hyphomicrobiales bacterium]